MRSSMRSLGPGIRTRASQPHRGANRLRGVQAAGRRRSSVELAGPVDRRGQRLEHCSASAESSRDVYRSREKVRLVAVALCASQNQIAESVDANSRPRQHMVNMAAGAKPDAAVDARGAELLHQHFSYSGERDAIHTEEMRRKIWSVLF